VQAAATSSEVRFYPAALGEDRAPVLGLNHDRRCETPTEDCSARLIDEFARRAD